MVSNHDATGSMLGYLYQCRYALLAALDAVKSDPSHELSIERFDDISFENSGTPHELIQTKHSINAGVLNDKSVDVWKTLLIWMKRAEEDPKSITRTRFVLLTTATADANCGVELLRHSDEFRNVDSAIEKLLSAAQGSSNQTTLVAREKFLSLDNAIRKLLVSNVWVFDCYANIIDVREDIEAALTLHAPLEKTETFTDYLEGWWFSRIIKGLTEVESPAIPLLSLHAKVMEISNNFSIANLPLAPGIEDTPVPPIDMDDKRTFIRQMRLIGLEEKHAAAGAKDYYRAFTQRSRWAREDLLLDDESRRYDNALGDAFEREAMAAIGSDDLVDDVTKKSCGQKMFHWSRRHPLPLRNRDEQWLSAGSFQMLSERSLIGWHPEYEKLLQAEEEK